MFGVKIIFAEFKFFVYTNFNVFIWVFFFFLMGLYLGGKIIFIESKFLEFSNQGVWFFFWINKKI